MLHQNSVGPQNPYICKGDITAGGNVILYSIIVPIFNSSWLGDFSWSEIRDVSNHKYVHLSFQFINYWMSSILQFMVWFSDKF